MSGLISLGPVDLTEDRTNDTGSSQLPAAIDRFLSNTRDPPAIEAFIRFMCELGGAASVFRTFERATQLQLAMYSTLLRVPEWQKLPSRQCFIVLSGKIHMNAGLQLQRRNSVSVPLHAEAAVPERGATLRGQVSRAGEMVGAHELANDIAVKLTAAAGGAVVLAVRPLDFDGLLRPSFETGVNLAQRTLLNVPLLREYAREGGALDLLMRSATIQVLSAGELLLIEGTRADRTLVDGPPCFIVAHGACLLERSVRVCDAHGTKRNISLIVSELGEGTLQRIIPLSLAPWPF